MDTALCTQNDLTYSAQKFAELTTGERSEKRRYLVCPACGGDAFFRNATRNDREACFGARPHAEDCHLSAAQATANPRYWTSTPNHPARRLVVDFEFGALAESDQQLQPDDVDGDSTLDQPTTRTNFYGTQVQHMRLRPLLRLLTGSTSFRASEQIVDVVGFGTFSVADFFVPFEAAAPMHSYRLHGFFGLLVHAQFDQVNTLWLNTGDIADLSICVPSQHIANLFGRFEVRKVEQVVGARALVLGNMQTSAYGKRYVVLGDISHIAIDLRED